MCSGTIHNATIARKNWDDMKMMSHLKALWDNAGLSKGSFKVNKHAHLLQESVCAGCCPISTIMINNYDSCELVWY